MSSKQASNIEIWWVECLRVLLGIIVIAELLHYRFVRDDIYVYYIEPTFHFSYTGFEWIRYFDFIPIEFTYWALILSVLLFTIGKFKQVSLPLTAILFGYFFLYERSAFLNHWYLIWLIFIVFAIAYPLQKVRLFKKSDSKEIKEYNVLFKLIQFLILVVYFYSGLSKINSDWILGYPFALLLPKYFGINNLSESVIILLSNSITFFEIGVVVLLLQGAKWLKNIAVAFCIIFHALNFIFLPIGFFPIIMIVLTFTFSKDALLFFQRKIKFLEVDSSGFKTMVLNKLMLFIIVFFVGIQLVVPLRKHYYYSNSMWDGRGQVFSWSMFTRTIGGTLEFRVNDPNNKTNQLINLYDFGITQPQYAKMKRNADLMYKMANRIKQSEQYNASGVAIYIESEISLNGRPPQLFIHPNFDLAQYNHQLLKSYPFIIPLKTPLYNSEEN